MSTPDDVCPVCGQLLGWHPDPPCPPPQTLMRPRDRPCSTCPYRRAVPSGIWSAEEYAKLAQYDGETWEQAHQIFECHQGDRVLCAGWVGTHDMDENLAIRVHHATVDIEACRAYVCPVPLFASGAEAAAHGMRDIAHPGPAARAAIAKLVRLRRLRRRPVW